MSPGFRYHVASLAAVFLALGVGILIGSSYVQGPIVERQTRRLAELRQQFIREVEPARIANRRYADFVAAAGPYLVGERLRGVRAAVVQTGDYPDCVRTVQEALEQAGAEVGGVVVIDPAFPARLAAGQGIAIGDAATAIRRLAAALARPGGDRMLGTLRDAHLLDYRGDFSQPAHAVVLVGGAREGMASRTSRVDVPLARELAALGARVAAAEPEAAAVSSIPDLAPAGIPTVDNADTDIGRIAIVRALGAPPADYGVKPTARGGILPPHPSTP